MKIIVEEAGYCFTKNFEEEHPSIEDAVFASFYLLGRIYPQEQLKAELLSLHEEL